ncbi:hypothetical protein [Vibrio harveyi]
MNENDLNLYTYAAKSVAVVLGIVATFVAVVALGVYLKDLDKGANGKEVGYNEPCKIESIIR